MNSKVNYSYTRIFVLGETTSVCGYEPRPAVGSAAWREPFRPEKNRLKTKSKVSRGSTR